jgi:hypothetical protein
VAICFPFFVVVVVVPFIVLLRFLNSVVHGGNQMNVLHVSLKSYARDSGAIARLDLQ